MCTENSSIAKHTTVAKTSNETNASNHLTSFKDPFGLYAINTTRTSMTVRMTPSGSGTLNRMLREMAVPTTSARSVAMIATSASMYNSRLRFGGKCFLQFWARSSPVTAPNLAHKHCQNAARMFVTSTENNSLYLWADPAATAVLKLPGSM